MKILIINSQGHWLNGWMTQVSSVQVVLELLKKAGIEANAVEVSSPAQLHQVLKKVSPNTLIWANAYWVNTDKGELHGLIETIEKYQLPLIGSGLNTLLQLLQKDNCQSKLISSGVPAPTHITISHDNLNEVHDRIANSDLEFPLVLKPTNESRSIGVTKANDMTEALIAAKDILLKFPNSKLIIETFLANDDITCGFLRMGNKEMILHSYNEVRGMDCKTEVFSQYHYTLPPHYEKQVCIEDTSILSQLETYLPVIVDLFDIQTTTRVDGRLDKNGLMNFFDINGCPGLNFPISALVKQCFAHFQNQNRTYLFECLINTIIADSLLRYNMSLPDILYDQNLFNLKSETIITVERPNFKRSLDKIDLINSISNKRSL